MKRGGHRHYLTGEISALEIYTVKKNADENGLPLSLTLFTMGSNRTDFPWGGAILPPLGISRTKNGRGTKSYR